jgi:hypothetical protein
MAESKKQSKDLIKVLDDAFGQLPKLPKSVNEVLVNIAPWLSLIFGILGIVGGLSAIGISPIAMFGGVDASFMVLATGIGAIISSILMLMAFPKLKKRAYKGWELLFWSEVVSAVLAVLSISVGSVLGILIGFYLLFQIKSYYK